MWFLENWTSGTGQNREKANPWKLPCSLATLDWSLENTTEVGTGSSGALSHTLPSHTASFLLAIQSEDSAQAQRDFRFLLTLVAVHHQYQMIGILTELGWE